MGRSGIAAACLILAASLLPDAARAIGTHTPLAWQQLVGPPADSVFEGQRKNTTWIRDANRNFIDDLIDNAQAETVDVILDFNRPLTFREIQSRFGPFGRIQYVSRVLTAAFLKDVRVSRIDSLARSPLVAMVEWQPPIRLSVVYSTREIQARANTSYPTYSSSAETPRGQTGVGVGIAILDTGVDEGHLSIPDATHGFDALNYEDTNANDRDDSSEPSPVGDGPDSSDELGEGDSNPEPCVTSGGVTTCQMHGTYVAGVALGRGYDDKTDQCAGSTTPDDEDGLAANCAGTASGADLVDVRVCPGDTGDCEFTDVTEGLEWLALRGRRSGCVSPTSASWSAPTTIRRESFPVSSTTWRLRAWSWWRATAIRTGARRRIRPATRRGPTAERWRPAPRRSRSRCRPRTTRIRSTATTTRPTRRGSRARAARRSRERPWAGRT